MYNKACIREIIIMYYYLKCLRR